MAIPDLGVVWAHVRGVLGGVATGDTALGSATLLSSWPAGEDKMLSIAEQHRSCYESYLLAHSKDTAWLIYSKRFQIVSTRRKFKPNDLDMLGLTQSAEHKPTSLRIPCLPLGK